MANAIQAIRKSGYYMGFGWLLILLSACSVIEVEHGEAIPANARWVLLPVINYAQQPQVGERVESIVATLIRARGPMLAHYPDTPQPASMTVFDDKKRYQSALAWAQTQPLDLGITGTVDEWRYKAGLDGEPAVGITLRIIELRTGRVLWSATGARSGWGRESITYAAHSLLAEMLDDAPFVGR